MAWEPTAMVMSQTIAPTYRRPDGLARASAFIAATRRKPGSTNRRVRGLDGYQWRASLTARRRHGSTAASWINDRVNAARRAAAMQKTSAASRPGDRLCAVAIQ